MPREAGARLSDTLTGQAAVLAELVAEYLESRLKQTGLTLGAFELLSAVHASPGVAQAHLAERLGITPSSLCEAVRTAVERGFVEQEGFAKDRRAKRVVLTRKGARTLDEALAALEEGESFACAGVPASKVSAAVEALRQAVRNLAAKIASA